MADQHQRGVRGDKEMAAELEELWAEARHALSDPELVRELFSELPDVDPDDEDLSDLFAWGREVARRGNLSPAKADALLRVAKRYAHSNR